MKPHILIKLDHSDIPVNKNEVRLFINVQDEIIRLPYFLKYYRNLGVDRFFFVDNNSKDGTTEFLLQQNDVHVFHTRNSFREARHGIDWQNDLLDRYGDESWCLYLDADELLVYPRIEEVNIKNLCKFMDEEGSDAMFTFMLDMYPSGSLSSAIYKSGESFFNVCDYFDKDYKFVKRFMLPWKKLFPPLEVIGGPRMRCFYNGKINFNFFYRSLLQISLWLFSALRKIGLPIPEISIKPPELCKIPLIKWKKGYSYKLVTHMVTEVKLSKVTGVIAHFKFFSDFHERAIKAVNSKEHAGGSNEYIVYLKKISSAQNLTYQGSLKYENSSTLLKTGLINTSDDYNNLLL